MTLERQFARSTSNKANRIANNWYAWKFATLALVGTNTPITVVSIPVKSASNLDGVVDRLLRFATVKFDIDWVDLDSKFYQLFERFCCTAFSKSVGRFSFATVTHET